MASQRTHDRDWQVIESYVNDTMYYLTKHQLDSYHDFVFKKIPYTIVTLNPFVMINVHPETKVVDHEIRIYIGGKDGNAIYLSKPTVVGSDGTQRALLPNEARLKDMNYATDVYVDILVEYYEYPDATMTNPRIQTQTFPQMRLTSLPIMLHSRLCYLHGKEAPVLSEMGECPYDQGGYFLIDGKEKVIIAQERTATNRLFVSAVKDPEADTEHFTHTAVIRCTADDNALFPKTLKFAVFGANYMDGARRNAIVLTCPNIQRTIPMTVLFRALGVESDREILRHIVGDETDPANAPLVEFLRWSITDGSILYTQAEALEYLARATVYKDIGGLQFILSNDVLPNVGKSYQAKALLLGHLIRTLVLTCLGLEKEADRDNYMHKRMDLSGFLMANLFRDLYNQFRNYVQNIVDNQYRTGPWRSTGNLKNVITPKNASVIFNSSNIERGFRSSFKGNWGTGEMIRQGIVQDLSRISYIGYVSHVRRSNTPLDAGAKVVGPHRLNPSHWGMVCPMESPDGANIGLLKHFAILTHVTFEGDTEAIRRCLADQGMCLLTGLQPTDIRGQAKVFLNDVWIGVHSAPDRLVERLRLLRRHNAINMFVGISWKRVAGEVHLRTSAGRLCRPLYLVGPNRTLEIDRHPERAGSWLECIRSPAAPESFSEYDPAYYPDVETSPNTVASVEFVDVEETNECMIAMSREDMANRRLIHFTHCEIHPSTILSWFTNTVPLANHNPGPRIVFSGAQGKQALCVYATNFNNRIDTMSYVLHYPQTSLVGTRYMKYANMDVLPNGENLIVAVASMTGYNQEDSIIINKRAIERGLFNITSYKAVVEEEDLQSSAGEKIVFANPMELKKKGIEVEMDAETRWNALDERGFPRPNSYIKPGDAYIGRCHIKTSLETTKDGTSLFGDTKVIETYTDKSIKGTKLMGGTVDKVFFYADETGTQTLKLRMRKMKMPVLGDKAASRFSQKGVIGMIMPHEDMPFTRDGLTPDIIINPHAFPTRQVMGQLIECILSKYACHNGTRMDGTIFENMDWEVFSNELETKYDLHRHGEELLYNGRSGEMIPTTIFMGPTYYLRLKHMVGDKINYRAGGAKTAMTRQPTKGRSRGGGLRIGEMETNSLLGHGIASFLKETMMERSDQYEYEVDEDSGQIAVYNPEKNIHWVEPDRTSQRVATIRTPYAWKLLLQEIESAGIRARLYTRSKAAASAATHPDQDEEDEQYDLVAKLISDMGPEEAI